MGAIHWREGTKSKVKKNLPRREVKLMEVLTFTTRQKYKKKPNGNKKLVLF